MKATNIARRISATPWLILRILSVLAFDPVRFSIANWNAATTPELSLTKTLSTSNAEEKEHIPGIKIAVVLRINKLVFNCAAVWRKPCSEKRVPPAKKHIPRTRRRLLRIEPTTVGVGGWGVRRID